MIETAQKEERVLLVAVQLGDEWETQESLDELAELVRTAGGVVVGRITQARERIHPGTYIGKGKIEEVAALIEMQDISSVVMDDELTPAQYNNLTDALAVKVVDRTMLILDIFAQRASTAEGKIQVELAQLRYRSARLAGLGKSMSRLGGGIGTRGPGEKKLEMDRRLIGKRISVLREELAEVVRHRELIRSGRKKGKTPPVAAIVGYTNAGKSTLLNYLTDAGVFAEDELFATLDPTTRAVLLPCGSEILLTDTVGFIRKLPHHLIEAFRSTLEEVVYADLIIHVADASNPRMDTQMAVVYETLNDLGAGVKPVYTLFNKIDLLEDREGHHLWDSHAEKTYCISAKTGEGIEAFAEGLSEFILQGQILYEETIPYAKAGLISRIRSEGQLMTEEYREDGIYVKALVPSALYGKLLAEV